MMVAHSKESHLSDRLILLNQNLTNTEIIEAVVRQQVRLFVDACEKFFHS